MLDATAGDVEVLGLDLYAYPAPAKKFGGDEGGAGTEEGVGKELRIYGCARKQPQQEAEWFGTRVVGFFPEPALHYRILPPALTGT